MNLRIIRFLNRSSTQIQAKFSAPLDAGIGISNISIDSNISNIAPLTIKSVEISNDVLTVNTSPQFPLVLYSVVFKSTSDQPFSSTDNDLIQEDGENNKFIFVGMEDENVVRTQMFDDMPDVFNVESPTPVRNYISGLAEQFERAQHDILETGNANYITATAENEIKTRGYSATDRLSNEGAYEVIRVSKTPGNAEIYGELEFALERGESFLGASNINYVNALTYEFPSDPISLRMVSVSDEIVSNAEIINNLFEKTTITLSKQNIAQIHSVKLITSGGAEYLYDIPTYKYAMLSNRYDTVQSYSLQTLTNRQFKLSESAILDGYFAEPQPLDQVIVSYSYIDNGINVNKDTVEVTQLRHSNREPVSALQNVFFLNYAPVATAQDTLPTSGGIQFLDPNPSSGAPYSSVHPAFKKEIAYDQARLPSSPGEYSVNYETAQVFVYGAASNNGTGGIPPVATYFYRKSFLNGIDYNFVPDTDEIAAVSTRDLVGETDIKISFDYEHVLAEGIDYISNVHTEEIDEPVDNRLLSTNKIITKKYPITNAFRVFNETTGETYLINRFSDYFVQISGRQLPRLVTTDNEFADFQRIVGESLAVTEVVSSTVSSKIIKIDLANDNILSEDLKYIGFNNNTSVSFTDTDLFSYEFYYDSDLQTLATNLSKISDDGYYLIDYVSGIVYARVPLEQQELGDINYAHARHLTQRPRVTGVNAISYRRSNAADGVYSITDFSNTSEYIDVSGLIVAGERFLSGNTDKPSILGIRQHGTEGQRTVNSNTFVALDAAFDSTHADGYHFIRFPDDSDRQIISVQSENTVTVDVAFTDSDKSVEWCLFDSNFSDGYTAATNYDIQSIRGIYSVTELQTLPAGQITNYYNPLTDSFSGNLITMNNASLSGLSAGDALIIDYDIGNIFFDYNYVYDSLVVSYEHGDNQLDFSISDSLATGDQYYVTYKYGALRQPLLLNFGSLTQIPELTDFPLNFDRELYRDAVHGALQAFLTGPTTAAISGLVSSITDVDPEIRELDFNEWTADRDNLYLQPPNTGGTIDYVTSGRDTGGYIGDGDYLEYPAEAYISLREATAVANISPNWRGIDNDAALTFTITSDGYNLDSGTDGYDGYSYYYNLGLNDGYEISLNDIFIGESAFNPQAMPFTISRKDEYPYSPIGRPHNYADSKGYFIWHDDVENRWKMRWKAHVSDAVDFTAEIRTTGEFYNVTDGYENNAFINEISDSFYTTADYIKFSTTIDGYDGYDGYLIEDGIDFSSDNHHYIFDTGPSKYQNRISLFKDGSGYLVGRVFDSPMRGRPESSRAYAISADISDWEAGQNHQAALSWRFNSADSIDELHLFVDGQEVSNNWKFGGKPTPSLGSDVFRTIATEVVLTSASKNTFSVSDGITVASSNIVTSASAMFVTNGTGIGDLLTILDLTSDGAASPHTITAVLSETQVTLASPLNLSLSEVNFSVNQLSLDAETDIDIEPFAVYVQTPGGDPVELAGLDATYPQYSISRASGSNTLVINDGVATGDLVYVNTLGLTRGRIRDKIYKYTSDNRLKTNYIPPESLSNIDIYKYIFDRISIESGSDGYITDGYFGLSGLTMTGTFTSLPQPSNTSNGKRLRFTLHGTDNINFALTNSALISGSAFGFGATTETVSFTSYGNFVTTKYFTSLNSIDFTFNGFDGYSSFGAIEVVEDISLTKSENNGDYAQIISYYNGNFRLAIFGSGGLDFNLSPTFYLIEYPTPLTIKVKEKGNLYIGSDINKENSFDGVFDEFHLLNEMLSDVRTGEEPPSDEKSVTRYYNSPFPAKSSAQSTMLLQFNGDTTNSSEIYKTYNKDYLTNSRSVNSEFGDCIVLTGEKQFKLTNDDGIIRQDSGTIEFWVSPAIDIYDDMERTRYYIDITSLRTEEIESITSNTVKLVHKAKKIHSIRLLGDDGTGTDYSSDHILGLDGRTITLTNNLPNQNILVNVGYTPVDAVGDRVSLYKDGYGYLNFEIKTLNSTSLISYPIGWERNTWHRVKATYNVNNQDNKDRMRLWVDGVEGGVVTWGSPGLNYGIGITYGSAGVLSSNFLTTNIDIRDTLSDIFVGNNYNGTGNAMIRLDNLRFSLQDRAPSVVAGQSLDLNYQENREAALPVIEDTLTTAIYDFDKVTEKTEALSNLLSRSTHLFNFDVNVIDSFDRVIGNSQAVSLIRNLINRIKPAHTRSSIKFTE